jgi:hypothetical protein
MTMIRAGLAGSAFLTVSLLCAAGDATNLLRNGAFLEAAPDGTPSHWVRRTRPMGRVMTHASETPPYVEIGVIKPGEDSFIQQSVAVDTNMVRLRLSARYRWEGVQPGEKSYQRGQIQARFTKGGAEAGDWVGLCSVEGNSREWVEQSKTFAVPADMDGLFVRLALYKVQTGRLDVADVRLERITRADIARERARFRPAEPFGAPVSTQRLARLARGININGWFCQPYNEKVRGQKGSFSAEHFRSLIVEDDLARIRKAGFTHVRLPTDPTPFIQIATGALSTNLLPELDRAIQMAVDRGLAISVDIHPKMPVFKTMQSKSELGDAFLKWWGEFARHLDATTDPEWVFIEPMNEPGGQGYYGATWSEYQDRLLTAIRRAAPRHTIVANPSGYQLVADLLKHEPHSDRNVIYAVHYYAPSQFTHQGALWMKEWYRPLRNIPWPMDEPQLAQALADLDRSGKNRAIAEEQTRGVLQRMVQAGIGKAEAIDADFAKLDEWCRQYDRRIVINEFGVFKPYAPADSRLRWLEHVRRCAERHGFGWAMWEYQQQLGFAEGEPGERKYDSTALQALGLPAEPPR